ncbi:MAG: hypothetical protein AAGF68_00145 [Pseudomonadota bacterium]
MKITKSTYLTPIVAVLAFAGTASSLMAQAQTPPPEEPQADTPPEEGQLVQAPPEEVLPGTLFTLTLGLGYSYEDEEDEPSESFLTGLVDAALVANTSNQRFAFSAGGLVELDEDDTNIERANTALNYAIFNRNTEASVDLAFRETEVDGDDLDEDFDADDLVDDDGTRETLTAGLRLITGRAARFGTDTRLGFREINYADTTDPDLVDETEFSFSTDLRFTVDRRIELGAFVTWSETEEDDAANRIETEVTAGLRGNFLLDRAWTGAFSLAVGENDIEEFGLDSTEDIVRASAAFARFMPNGTLAIETDLDSEDDAAITTLSVTRTLGLANGAALAASIGAAHYDNADTSRALFGLSYDNEIARGRFLSVAFNQTADRDDDDSEILRSTFDITYDQALTRNSQLRLTGGLAGIEVVDDTDDDTLRANIGVSYRHDLAQDWSFVASADHTVLYEDGERDDSESVLSLGVERRFSFRP